MASKQREAKKSVESIKYVQNKSNTLGFAKKNIRKKKDDERKSEAKKNPKNITKM